MTSAPINMNSYRANGWYLAEKIFSDADIDEMIAAVEEFYANKRERSLPANIQELFDWKPGMKASVHTNEYIDYQKTVIRKHMLNPRIGEIAAKLMGVPEVFIFNTVLFAKPPTKDHNETPWHIDQTYLDNFSTPNSVAAWIPLQDIGPNDSPLLMISGSQNWDFTEEDEKIFAESMPYSSEPKRYTGFPLSKGKVDVDVVPLIMKKGQVSFHHIKTVHARCSNYSSESVSAITIHVQDGNNHFKPWNSSRSLYFCKNFSEQLYRKLPDGKPDFYDPDFCPRMWPPL